MSENETVTTLEVLRRTPFAGGAVFGAAGPYERVDGRLHFAVDPLHPANTGIVDLNLAARDARRPGALRRRPLPAPAGRSRRGERPAAGRGA